MFNECANESEIDGIFASLDHLHAGALVVAFFRAREQLVALRIAPCRSRDLSGACIRHCGSC
jgi:hypothetical protein